MATIRPFRGLRYDLSKAGSPARLLAPPYDVVDAAKRAELGARSPHNCIHVILPEGEGDSKYARGAAEFRRLIDEALARDGEPGIYVYHQRFTSEGQTYTRKGFICLIELTRFGHGPVLAHERTLKGPKEDRLKLMRACDAHVELVFGMFSDSERAWEQAVAPELGAPVLEAEFDGSHHTLFRVSDAGAVQRVVELLADRSIYIADGHHRYETMCAFRDELAATPGRRGADPRFGMIYLSNLDDPGLVVLPTHRMVNGVKGIDVAGTVAGLDNIFDVSRGPLPADVTGLRKHLAAASGAGARAAFALAVPGCGELITLSLKANFDPSIAGLGSLPEALQRLDVVLLHELVLDRGFGISRAAQADKTNIHYYKSSERALAVAHGDGAGEIQVACFMNATPVADVVAVCDSGHVMPQKSTFFYPKIPTGLAFYDLGASTE
jgi:uncharacterized protein (DUF1015 family)